MKNKTWLYLDNSHVGFNLHMNRHFKAAREYVREYDDSKVYVEAYIRDSDIIVKSWYEKNPQTSSVFLFEIKYPYVKDQKIYLSISLPNTNPCNWVSPSLTNYVSTRLKPTKENAYYYEHNIGYAITPKIVENGKVGLTLKLDEYFTKSQAKKIWKIIKKNNLVSKFSWDSWLGFYDCYCKACEVDGIKSGEHVYNWRSWVGNPDVGYVRPVVENKGARIFTYKGKLYEPCRADEYNRLTFFNKSDYKDAVRNLSEHKSFEKIWSIDLTDKEITDNGNSIGGAWKTPDGRFLGNKTTEKIPKGSEKVVTLGWHNTNPVNAVRCPVCDDIANVINHSVYDPVPWVYRLRERLASKLWGLTKILERRKWNKSKNKE